MPRHPPYALISLISVLFVKYLYSTTLFPFGFFILTSSFQVNYKTFHFSQTFYCSLYLRYIYFTLYSFNIICVFSSIYMQLSMCVSKVIKKHNRIYLAFPRRDFSSLSKSSHASGISCDILDQNSLYLLSLLRPFRSTAYT